MSAAKKNLIEMLQNVPAHVRGRFYVIALAVIALATAYGVIGAAEAPLWVTLVAAVFGIGGTGLASANSTRKPPATEAE
jgi:hypothetical protein